MSKSVKQNVKERISVETKDENKIKKILFMRFIFIVSKLKQLDNIKQSSLIQSTNEFLTEFNFIILRQLNIFRETTDHGFSEEPTNSFSSIIISSFSIFCLLHRIKYSLNLFLLKFIIEKKIFVSILFDLVNWN